MMTITGRLVEKDFGAPDLRSIAYGLARIPRFAGHTVAKWTVADHSLVVYRIARGDIQPREAQLPLYALLHDAHESVTGDVPTSFKTDEMRKLQDALDRRIYAELGLPGLGVPRLTDWQRKLVKWWDERALSAEAKLLTPEATYERIRLESRAAFEPDVEIVHFQLDDVDPEETFYNLAVSELQLFKRRMAA